MTGEPRIEERPEQSYIAIRRDVTPETFTDAIDSGFPELFALLRERGIEPAGPPFINYVAFDSQGAPSAIEIGAPVPDGSPGADTLPAGRYAVLLHVGPFRSDSVPDLADAREELLAWGEREGVEWDGRASLERYLTDPREEPDSSKWQTELASLIR